MKPIFIFRHVECEGPGYLAEILERHTIPYRIICIDQEEPVPEQISETAALVFMGGYMSVKDKQPWIEKELNLIRPAVHENMPVLGHCLGGQLIAKALNGEVTPSPLKEIGWHPVQRLANTAADDWLGTLPSQFNAFHWHGETFSIPEGATPILKSQHCANQAFAMNNTLALQCHVEMTESMVNEWVWLYQKELSSKSPTIQSVEEISQDLTGRVVDLQKAAEVIYMRWLQPLL
jgi:GMP synthase-like glutamine amidotransferase